MALANELDYNGKPEVAPEPKPRLLDPGFNLTLRPMRYEVFYNMYVDAIANTWTVDEVDFTGDIDDLRNKLTSSERHLINRLVAFFATGDSIVANNLVLNLYQHINAPEARMYLSRQLYEEALHVQFYLTLLDTYIPKEEDREEAFDAINNIPSIHKKAEFCFKWLNSLNDLSSLETKQDRRQFILNLICFAACIEGLFFFGAFAYVYFLRSKGLLNGLADGTNWVFRDESGHMNFAFEVVRQAHEEEPDLFDEEMKGQVLEMMIEAVECETLFAEDLLQGGVPGLSLGNMEEYLKFVADQRLTQLGMDTYFKASNPLDFMELQNVDALTNFFERRVSDYQIGIKGDISFDNSF